jgi:hypothetical protein
MSNPECISIVAEFLVGRIERKNLSPHNNAVLDFYLGLMPDNAKFAAEVNARKNQLLAADGQRTSLYPPEVIKKMARHKRRIGKIESAFQPGLWPEEPTLNNENCGLEKVVDPEKNIFAMGIKLNSRFYSRDKNTLITQEIKEKKSKLRDLIGLPVARGKDPHVKDNFYKYLVKKICTFDTFGIFIEYDRVLDEVPAELDLKITQIKDLTDELLNKGLSRQQRFRRFNQFVEEYRERGNI